MNLFMKKLPITFFKNLANFVFHLVVVQQSRQCCVGVSRMKNNQLGMTLLEVMLTVTILMAIISVLPLMMNAAVKSSGEDLQHQEAQLFYHLFSKEVREASGFSLVGESIEMMNADGTVVLYERYGSSIRRRVNGTGHEIVLQHIKKLIIGVSGRKVKVEVELVNGRREERTFFQMANSNG